MSVEFWLCPGHFGISSNGIGDIEAKTVISTNQYTIVIPHNKFMAMINYSGRYEWQAKCDLEAQRNKKKNWGE